MNRVKLLPQKQKKPQCQALREGKYYNDKPDTDRQCCFSASYEFDGLQVCSRHASVFALRVLMGEDE